MARNMKPGLDTTQREDYGYARISKEDQGLDSRPVEELLEDRRFQILYLAESMETTISPSNVMLEAASATNNAGRQKFLALLELVRVGRVGRLFVPQFDRLMRVEMTDAARIYSVFKASGITLITDAHVWDFSDPDFDYKNQNTYYQSALQARQTVLETSHKLKKNNPIRARKGVQMAGEAAYGIDWVQPIYRNRKLVEPGYYVVVEEEWRVVEEAFRLIQKMGARRIATHFTKLAKTTGWPLTPQGRTIWNHSTILVWIGNPIYCGWPAHRFANVTLKHKVSLHRSKWILSNTEQQIRRYISDKDYVDSKLLTLEEWERLQDLVSSRKQAPTERASSLRGPWLTGILFCSNGRGMTSKQHYYTCDCSQRVDAHAGSGISQPKFESAVKHILKSIIEALPIELIIPEKKKADDRDVLRRQLNLLLKQQIKLAASREGYMGAHGLFVLEEFGEAQLKQNVDENKREIDSVNAEIANLQEALNQPDLSGIVPTLFAVQAVGFNAVWEEMDAPDRKAISRQFLKRIQIVTPTGRYVDKIRVVTQEWVKQYCDVPEEMPVPKNVFRRAD